MKHLEQIVVSAAAAVFVWVVPANAAPPEPNDDIANVIDEAPEVPAAARWLLIEARDHARGASSPVALLFGRPRKEGANGRPACASIASRAGRSCMSTRWGSASASASVAVAYSLDGGRFVSASWQASADGGGLKLSGDRAVAFLGELYGKAELRLALVRPLSVPFLFTFAVGGAEQGLGTIADRCHWSAAPAISEAGR